VPWTWAAAAAILLAVGASGATAAWMRGAGPASPADVDVAAAPADVDVAAWEADVRSATAELTDALAARRSEIDPETLAIVERNLAIIDRAIEETRDALEAEPLDPRARDALLAAYNQKIRVLQRTLRLPAS
jgi:hypothetical protein